MPRIGGSAAGVIPGLLGPGAAGGQTPPCIQKEYHPRPALSSKKATKKAALRIGFCVGLAAGRWDTHNWAPRDPWRAAPNTLVKIPL